MITNDMLVSGNFLQAGCDRLKNFAMAVFMICATFFVTVHAQDSQDQEYGSVYHELVFNIGVRLSGENAIVDVATMKTALLNLYQNDSDVQQIVAMYLALDEEMVENNITTMDELIDYELNGNETLSQATIALLAAYQQLFTIFIAVHQQDSSFETWCDDMAFFASLTDDQQPADQAYYLLWLASYAVIEAQTNFEVALKSAE